MGAREGLIVLVSLICVTTIFAGSAGMMRNSWVSHVIAPPSSETPRTMFENAFFHLRQPKLMEGVFMVTFTSPSSCPGLPVKERTVRPALLLAPDQPASEVTSFPY
jgi:hypothetical protein